MNRRTLVAVVAVCGLLAGAVVVGLGVGDGGLAERWISDTPRANEVNHHAVGVGTTGDVVVAPVAAVPNGDEQLTDTSCALVRLRPETGATQWRAGVPAEDCFTHALTEPAVADVDGDGTREVLVASTEGAVIARSATDGTEEWRVGVEQYGYGRPTVADVTAGPGLEVVASDVGGEVVAVHGNGTVAWRTSVAEAGVDGSAVSVWRAPVVADLDADDAPEVLIATNRGPVVFSATGTVEWTREGGATYAAVGQADDDPALELFTGDTGGVVAYDGATGETQWERSLTNVRVRETADVDGDGVVELFAGRPGGEVLALGGATGTTQWSTTVSTADGPTPSPVAGDVDGDDETELVAVTNDGSVAVLSPATGAQRAVYERAVPIWTFPTITDTDGDGRAEVLVRYGDGRVVALSYDGDPGLVAG